jgi:hypothetical protein
LLDYSTEHIDIFKRSKMDWLRISVLLSIVISLLVCANYFIRNLQYRLLYYPGASAPPPELLQTCHVLMWQSSGAGYRGLVPSNETIYGKGAIVVFHGNAGTAAGRIFYMDCLGALGYRVILAEYPMYGGREGELGEKAFVSDAKETIRLAFEEYGGPIFILGESMGCGVAAAAAAGEISSPIDGMILITPWDSLESIARSAFPFFPVRLFLRDKYDSIGNLASFKGRIAVVGAARDEVIPIEHARHLYRSLSSASKHMWTIQDAGHNDWSMHVDEIWWKEVTDFISGNILRSGTGSGH